MKILTLDYETFWDTDYTLSKMTTESYIRDPRFYAHMVGLQMDDGQPVWVPHDKIPGIFEKINWEDTAVLAQHCMPGDVEVYTPFGWKRLDSSEVRAGVKILQWDCSDESITWGEISEKQVSIAKSLLQWDSNFHKCAYTDNHRMYYTTPDLRKYDHWKQATANEICGLSLNNTYIPLAGYYDNELALAITPIEARFIEAVRADGKLDKGQIVFHFIKQRKIDRLKWLCKKLGVTLTPTTTTVDKAQRFRITNKDLVNKVNAFFRNGKSYHTNRVLQLSFDCRLAILEEAAYWDGSSKHNSRYGAYTLATTDAATVDGFQLMAHITGWSVSGEWRENNRGYGSSKGNNKPLYIATVRPRKMAKLQYKPERIEHNDKVYCVTVPDHAFLIRSKGRVLITGNSHFDGLILSHHYGIKPAFWLDTLSMFRALYPAESASLANQCRVLGLPEKGHELINSKGKQRLTAYELEELGGYCKKDVMLTRSIFDLLKRHFPVSELRLIDLTVRLFTEPILLFNQNVLREALKEEQDRIVGLLSHVYPDQYTTIAKAIYEKDKASLDLIKKPLSSNPQFAEALMALGVDPPKKLSPAAVKKGLADPETNMEAPIGLLAQMPKKALEVYKALMNGEPHPSEIWTYAFSKSDEQFKHLLEHENEDVATLVEARFGVKSTIRQTRTERFMGIGERGAWPVYIRYAGAHTLRWSGGDNCLAENTKVTVLTEKHQVLEKNIQDVSLDDRVWDGINFVEHDGVVYQGQKEVMFYDGIEATPDHKVWVEGEDAPRSLSSAAERGDTLLVAAPPDNRCMDSVDTPRGS